MANLEKTMTLDEPGAMAASKCFALLANPNRLAVPVGFDDRIQDLQYASSIGDCTGRLALLTDCLCKFSQLRQMH